MFPNNIFFELSHLYFIPPWPSASIILLFKISDKAEIFDPIIVLLLPVKRPKIGVLRLAFGVIPPIIVLLLPDLKLGAAPLPINTFPSPDLKLNAAPCPSAVFEDPVDRLRKAKSPKAAL